MVEVEKNNYASRGTAGTALGFGIGGAALGILNTLGAGLFAGRQCDSDNMPVSRYDLAQQQKIAELQSGIALRDANAYGDQKLLEVYKYIDGELKDIRTVQSAQAVHNQRTEDSFALVREDVASVKAELSREIAVEAERRCCGDNAIVTYANATFYPKMVADVTTGTGTTAQSLYNPLPKCGWCNGN